MTSPVAAVTAPGVSAISPVSPSGPAGHVQPQDGVRGARLPGGGAARLPAGAGIDQPVRPVQGHALLRGGQCGFDVAPPTGAAIQQPHLPEPVQRLAVGVHPVGLAHRRLRPGEPEPAQVLADLRLPLRPGAGAVDILDPEQEGPAPRPLPRHQRGIGMAQMQRAGRRGGETGNHGCPNHGRRRALLQVGEGRCAVTSEGRRIDITL